MAVGRDISLLLLTFLTGISILPIGVILFFLVKGLHRLRQLAKQGFPVAQEKAQLMADMAEKASLKVAAPVISIQAKTAQVDGVVTAIRMRRKTT
jgi:hypothetical protein